MNKIILLTVIIGGTFFISCKKNKCDLSDSNIVASAAEITVIQNYLNTNSLTATQHSSGLFYFITNGGSGDSPDLCSSVTVKYKGSLLSGSVFDESTASVSFQLKDLIVGWQKGIPLIQKGGHVKLYVPPSLGYGNMSQSGIPANSTLIFEIDLIGVEK